MTDTETDLVERLQEGPIRTGDTEDGEYELFDIEEATQTMLEAASALKSLKAERDEAFAQVDALSAKVEALAPHGMCGCSYDTPDDLCLHHSPKLIRAEAENASLMREIAELRAQTRC